MQEVVKDRIRWILAFIILGFPLLLFRFFHLQYILYDQYAEMAIRNLDRYKDVVPRRGAIYDKNGRLLVKTSPCYQLMASMEGLFPEVKNQPEILNEKSIENIVELLKKSKESEKNQKDEEEYITIEKIRGKILSIYEKIQKDIEKALLPHSELEKRSPKKYLRKKWEIKKDYYRRKYLVLKDIPAKAAQTFHCQKSEFIALSDTKAEFQDLYPGFSIDLSVKRDYTYSDLAPHLLGRLNIVANLKDKARKNLIDHDGYAASDFIGISGIEKIVENSLRGKRGCRVNSREDKDGYIFMEKSIDGEDIYLTIDSDLQEFAEKSLDRMVEKRSDGGAIGGSAVVLDIHTGEILILASSPRYEIEKFSENYQKMVDDPQHPLVHRAISCYYPVPPGSVFKVAVAAYALEKGIIDENTCYVCQKYMYQKGRFACTHHHGNTEIIKAIAGSCNIFFYHVGQEMGAEQLADCAYLFGFGSKSTLGFDHEENAGHIPTPENKPFNEKWGHGDSRMFGIGQLITATPLQVARSIAMLANMGIMPRLQIIKKQEESHEQIQVAYREIIQRFHPTNAEWKWPISPRTWALVKEGMRQTIENQQGTAYSLKKDLKNVRIGCKTGTSQVKGKTSEGKDKTDHSWFAGFFPFHKPKYAFAVLIEHGGYGATAAGPVAVDIINKITEKDRN